MTSHHIDNSGDNWLSHTKILIALVGGAFGMGLGADVGNAFLSDGGDVLGAIVGFLAGTWILFSAVDFIAHFINVHFLGLPHWFEFGETFSYSNSKGIHVYQWGEVGAVHFEYEQGFVDPDSDADYEPSEDNYATYLEVSLASEKPVRIMIGGGCKASRHSADILKTLATGLQNGSSSTRLACAEGLGKFCTDACPRGTPGGIRAKMGDFVLDDAAEAVAHLQLAAPQLQKAAEDDDLGVRQAATATLRRIESLSRLAAANEMQPS